MREVSLGGIFGFEMAFMGVILLYGTRLVVVIVLPGWKLFFLPTGVYLVYCPIGDGTYLMPLELTYYYDVVFIHLFRSLLFLDGLELMLVLNCWLL